MEFRRLLLPALIGLMLAAPNAIASDPPNHNSGAEFHAIPEFADIQTPFHESCALNVSHDGQTVVGWSRDNHNSAIMAFKWTEETGFVSLGDFPMGLTHSEAWAASADGSIVVGFGYTDSGPQAFRWFGKGDLQPLIHPYGEVFPTAAYGISPEGGYIVGQAYNSGCGTVGRAFLWSQDSGFRVLQGNSARPDPKRRALDPWVFGRNRVSPQAALAVSSNGTVVVGRGMTQYGPEAFLWTDEHEAIGLGDLRGGEHDSVAHAVTSDGQIVVGRGWSENGPEAFRWTEQTGMVGLGDLPDGLWSSEALAVCDDGSVIVGTSSTMSGNEAFIWRRGGPMRFLGDVLMTEYGLELNGLRLVSANGLCGLGQTVVGWGVNPQGKTEMWVAKMATRPAISPDQHAQHDLYR